MSKFPLLVSIRLLTRSWAGVVLLVWPLLWLGACQEKREARGEGPPPVGRYEGSLQAYGQATRMALDIRHPSPGHYEAEVTVGESGGLSFVADTIYFTNNQLRLVRPGRADETLALTLEGDFWRGTLQLDSVKTEALLVKRGPPSPSTYRVEELPQDQGSAWLFSPADTETPGMALAMLPDKASAAAAPLWADALAREGIIVLVLPAADSSSEGLGAALRLLRTTPGADTAAIGVWAGGQRAATLAVELAGPGGLRTAFLVAQQVEVDPGVREDFRALAKRRLPVLGLYGGPKAAGQAARLRAALGGRRAAVRHYREAGADLLSPGPLAPHFGPGLPGDVVDWLRSF